MKKIDDYIDNIYKTFDETDEETRILKEETKSHLYEEIEDLKKQGLGENESIEKAILNFGQENIVIGEMNTVLKKQNKFSKILISVALIIYLIGFIFKLINVIYDFSNRSDKLWQQYQNDKYCSEYVLHIIQDKISDKNSLDENVKNEITILLDEFNTRTNNGLYYIGIEKSGDYCYEYSKEISEELIKINLSGSYSWGKSWNMHYKSTDFQNIYDVKQREILWNKVQSTTIYRLNELSNYFFIISWILVCISFINKAYMKKLISKRYIAFFVCISILILGLFSIGKHCIKDAMIFIIGVMILLSKFYSKYYFSKRLN